MHSNFSGKCFLECAVEWKSLHSWPRSFDQSGRVGRKPVSRSLLATRLLGGGGGGTPLFLLRHSTARGRLIRHCTGTRQHTTLSITPTAITIVTDIQVNVTPTITLFHKSTLITVQLFTQSYSCFCCHHTANQHHFIWHRNRSNEKQDEQKGNKRSRAAQIKGALHSWQ